MQKLKCWGLLMFMSLTGALAATTVDGVLSEDGTVLTVTVESGEAELGTAHLAALTANQVQRLVKAGDGTLVVPSALNLSAYGGTIEVTAGIYRFEAATGVGALTADATITVTGGAALEARPASGVKPNLRGKRIVFAGQGPDAMGALRSAAASDQDDGFVFGDDLVMTGDATIAALTAYRLVLGGSAGAWKLDMGGYDLELRGYAALGGKNSKELRIAGTTQITNAGDITVPQGNLSFRQGSADGDFGSGSLTIAAGDYGQANLEFSKSRLPLERTLVWDTTRTFNVSSTTLDATTGENAWSGPLTLLKPMTVSFGTYQDYQRLTLGGKVSGAEGLVLGKSADTVDAELNLLSADNDFAGAVTADGVNVRLATPGALPAAGAGLVTTDARLTLEGMAAYSLPGATFAGNSEVVGGNGAWTQPVVYDGEGVLNYQSSVGGTALTVKSGSVLFSQRIDARFAGLIAGCRVYTTTAEVTADYDAELIVSNQVELIPAAAYDYNHAWWSKANSLITYDGYIWNNGEEPVTWSFATALGTKSKLKINGTLVCEDTFWSDRMGCGRGNAVLQPGANRITLWIMTDAKERGPLCLGVANNPLWQKSKFGFVYDPQGRNAAERISQGDPDFPKASYNYYKEFPETGDAQFFSWAKPGERGSYLKPGTEEKIDLTPSFTTVTCAAGSTLDFGGLENYETANLVGAPIVAGCDCLGVTGSWSFPLDLPEDTWLFTSDRLDFSGSVLTPVGAKRAAATVSRVIASASEGIVQTPTLAADWASAGWELKLSEDSTELRLEWRQPGFVLLIR